MVAVDGTPVDAEQRAYWMVNKPRGVVTTVSDPEGRPTVLDLLPAERADARLFPVGRLDRDTEGLVLLTNDGALAQALLHPSLGSEREYQVTVRGRAGPDTLARLAAGVLLEDGPTAPAQVGEPTYSTRPETTRFSLTLVEGRKRQIRRALALLGHPVVELLRVRMGPLQLTRLAVGEARQLNARERRALLRVLAPRE